MSSPATFTGSSAFSASLAQQISNALNIASIPMQNLQSQQSTLQSQQSELGTLSGDFTSLATALSSVDSSTGSGSYAASVGTPAVASASVGSGVMAGTYSLTVTNTGANTNTISNDSGLIKVTDPTQSDISTSTSFTLMVNSTSYTSQTPMAHWMGWPTQLMPAAPMSRHRSSTSAVLRPRITGYRCKV